MKILPTASIGPARSLLLIALVVVALFTSCLPSPVPKSSAEQRGRAAHAAHTIIRSCYLEGLNRRKDLSGDLTVNFKIDSEGRTRDVQVAAGSLSDEGVVQCVRLAASGWDFDKPQKPGVKITQVIGFVRVATTAQHAAGMVSESVEVDDPAICIARDAATATAVSRESSCAPNCKARLEKSVVRKVVRASYSRLSECYVSGLSAHPELTGKVEIFFAIGSDGAVFSAHIGEATTLPNCAVADCIRNVFTTLKFPEPEGEGVITVRYPVKLQPG